MTYGHLDYSKLTDEIFGIILAEIVLEKGADLLRNPKIYAILSKELNNEVIEKWEKLEEEKLLNEKDENKKGENEPKNRI